MRSVYQPSIQRNDIHQRAKAEGFLEQRPANFELRKPDLWIKEKFNRVVARLTMDINGAGIIGCLDVVKPVVVGKPGIRLGYRNQIASPWVIDMRSSLALDVQHLGNTWNGLQ